MPAQRTARSDPAQRKVQEPGRKRKPAPLEQEKQVALESEVQMVQSIKSTIESMSTPELGGVGSSLIMPRLDLVMYKLFSSEHVDLCYDKKFFPTMYVEFARMPECGRGQRSDYNGHVYLEWEDVCTFTSYTPPTKASTRWHQINTGDARPMQIQFITQRHVILKLSRQVVLAETGRKRPGPDWIEYVGVLEGDHTEMEDASAMEQVDEAEVMDNEMQAEEAMQTEGGRENEETTQNMGKGDIRSFFKPVARK